MKKSVVFFAAASLLCAVASAQVARVLPPNSTTNARAVGNIVMPIVPVDVCTASNKNCFTSSTLPDQQSAPFLGFGGVIKTFIANNSADVTAPNWWIADGVTGQYTSSTWSAIELANGNGTRFLISSLQNPSYSSIVLKFADGSTCALFNSFGCPYIGKSPVSATAVPVFVSNSPL